MNLAERRGIDSDVYEPAEDSSLLAAAVGDRLEDADLVLDVGTGSGYVGERVAEATDARVLGSDVNPHACRRARDRGIEAVRADLVAPFRAETFDAVLFNPPYLPAVEEVEGDGDGTDWLELAVAGGETGRGVIERFLDEVGRVLVPDGVVFLLVSTATGVDEVVEYGGEQGFSAVAVDDVSFPGETLTVLEFLEG